jgi:NTE family protein
MGADIVIVVDISAPLSKKEDIKSSVDVTGQLTTVLTRRIADIQLKTLKDKDVLIIPGAAEITSSDFDKYPELIKAGEESATKSINAIQKLSLSDDDYSDYTASLPTVANKNPIIDFVDIHNDTALNDEVMQIRIHQKTGEPLDIPQLEEDLSYIYGLDFSSSVVYSLEERDGETGLIIYVRDREWAHSYLQFGLSIKSESNIGSLTNFDAAYTKNNLNDLAGEFRATAGIGSEPELSAEIYQPLNVNLDFFVSAKTGLHTTVFPNTFNDKVDSIERFHRTYIDLSTGKILDQTTRFNFGYYYSDGYTDTISGNSLFSDGDFREGLFYTSVFHDSLDNLSFPNTGFFGGLGFKASQEKLGADEDYEQIQLMLSGAGTYKRYTVFTRAILETTINEDAPFNALFRRGGFLELSGSLNRELAGQNFGLLEVAFYKRLGNITFLPIYTGFSVETGNVWHRLSDVSVDNTIFAGSIFIGADTFLGPLYLAFGFNDDGQQALYFNIGQTFLEK